MENDTILLLIAIISFMFIILVRVHQILKIAKESEINHAIIEKRLEILTIKVDTNKLKLDTINSILELNKTQQNVIMEQLKIVLFKLNK